VAFVGSDRQQLIRDFTDAYRRIESGNGAEIFVLMAPSGVGKTRLIQEFYCELALDQTAPSYWPTQLVDPSGDWLHSRKVVYPTVVTNEPGASMPWMWWGITCSRRPDGTYGQALFEHAPQLFAHGGALFERSRLGARIGESLDVGDAVVGVLSLLGMSLAAPVVMPLTFAGVARTAWTNRDLMERIKRRKKLRSARPGAESESGSFGRDDQADELIKLAVELSTAVPLILVIEDAHWADPVLVRFLCGILGDPRSRVLVLATTWPLEDDENVPIQSIFRADESGFKRHTVVLGDLGPGELADLVQAEFQECGGSGRLPQDVVAAVLDAVRGSPLAVRVSFSSPRVRERVRDGTFDQHTVRSMPRGAEQALERYWDELPASIQQILKCASVAGAQFPQSPILTASHGMIDRPSDQLSAAVRRGVVRDFEGLVGVFADPVFHRVAAVAASEDLSHGSVLEIAARLAEYALSIDGDDFPAECAWSVHLALAQEGLVDAPPAAASALALARLARGRFDHEAALHMLELVRSLDPDPPLEIDGRTRLGYASIIGELGGHKESIAVLDELLRLPELRSIADGDLVLEARRLKARQSGALGLHDVAVRILEEIEAEMAYSGRPIREVVGVRSLIAEHLSGSGDHEHAVEHFAELVRVANEEFGDQDVLTLMLANNLSASLSDAGRDQESVDVAENVLPILIDQFGEVHPFVLSTRQNRAICLGSLGRRHEAIDELRSVYMARARVLGELHPDTLQSLNSLAIELGLSDDNEEEALTLMRKVTEARQIVLGGEHPLTLSSARNLATQLLLVDQVAEAVQIRTEVAEANRKNLGASHPETLEAFWDLAGDLNALGDHERALIVIRETIERSESMGELLSSEDVMTYGLALLGAGQPELARAQFSQAVELPGVSENQRLRANLWISYCFGAAGEHGAAVEGFRRLEWSSWANAGIHPRDRVRILLGWGYSERMLGEMERAITVWEIAAGEAEDALGPFDPETISALSNLANGRGVVGDVSAAIDLHQEVIVRLKDSNGPIELMRNQLRGLAVDFEASGNDAAAERTWQEYEALQDHLE